MNTQPKRYRRSEASAYLHERWGISRTPGTLAKYASIGGGPKYQLANTTPLYPEPELDTWAQSLLSPLKSNTSDTEEDKIIGFVKFNGPEKTLEICRAQINKDKLCGSVSIGMDPKQMNSSKIFGADGNREAIWWEESIKDVCHDMAIKLIELVRKRREE